MHISLIQRQASLNLRPLKTTGECADFDKWKPALWPGMLASVWLDRVILGSEAALIAEFYLCSLVSEMPPGRWGCSSEGGTKKELCIRQWAELQIRRIQKVASNSEVPAVGPCILPAVLLCSICSPHPPFLSPTSLGSWSSPGLPAQSLAFSLLPTAPSSVLPRALRHVAMPKVKDIVWPLPPG